MANASVNKGFLIGVVAVAAAALLALAYQLGRASESGTVSAPQTRIERVAPRPQEEPAPLPTTAAPSITEHADTPLVFGPAPSIPPGQSAPPQAAAGQMPAPIESGIAGSDPMRAAVAVYLDAVDRIQAGAVNGEPDGIAHEMAAALANGDTSSLDKMIRETEAARARLAVVTPPGPCAGHHRETLGSLDDALDVLRSLKAAMESPEPLPQFANVSTRAAALRSRAEALQKEELALRERYGLKR